MNFHMKKVNPNLQCLAILFIPTGLLAFKRIGKFKLGILVYLLSFVIMYVGIMAYMFLTWDHKTDIITYGSKSVPWMGLISTLIPMIFIRHWSIQFNKKIEEEQKPIR